MIPNGRLFVFENKCPVCGCKNGAHTFQWSDLYDPKRISMAAQFGHRIQAFKCADCGALTTFEELPMVTDVSME